MTIDNDSMIPSAIAVARSEDTALRAPDSAAAHAELSEALHHAGQMERAIHHARMACGLAREDNGHAVALARLLEEDRQYPAAWEIVDRLLAAGVHTVPLALLYARMSRQRKCQHDALQMIHRALRVSRSNAGPAGERASLHFVAAGLLDQVGRYDEAFEQASKANALRGLKYDGPLGARLVGDFMSYFTRGRLSQLPRAGGGSEVPVFIVGMPRSGLTLVEQILASHPAVYGAGALDQIFRLWESAVHRRSTPTTALSQCLDRLTADDANELSAAYIERLAALSPAALRITDTTHTSYLHLGLIQILFPQAKVIHCRRDPLDACLSCFMTDFSMGNNFSTDLAWAGHAWRLIERMMSHWKSVLDLPILEVEYEHIVLDVEGEARRMLEFIGLPWDERCLQFYENRRYVAGPAAGQVKQPIYQSSVGRWRNYDKHLGALRGAL